MLNLRKSYVIRLILTSLESRLSLRERRCLRTTCGRTWKTPIANKTWNSSSSCWFWVLCCFSLTNSNLRCSKVSDTFKSMNSLTASCTMIACIWTTMTRKWRLATRFQILLESSTSKKLTILGNRFMNPKTRIPSCLSTSTARWPASVMTNMRTLDCWLHSSLTEPMASIKYLWKRESS